MSNPDDRLAPLAQLALVELRSGCTVERPAERLLRFCREEFDYYDAVLSGDPNRIEPVDILATVAVNSFITTAARVRQVHRGLAAACDPLLRGISPDADLLTFDPSLDQVRELLDAAVQVPWVLLPVATKVLHRKRPQLIPMLDSVLLRHYLGVPLTSELPPRSQDKQHAADVGVRVLKVFRDDLRAASPQIQHLREALATEGYALTDVRVLELLIWTELEERGYYRG